MENKPRFRDKAKTWGMKLWGRVGSFSREAKFPEGESSESQIVRVAEQTNDFAKYSSGGFDDDSDKGRSSSQSENHSEPATTGHSGEHDDSSQSASRHNSEWESEHVATERQAVAALTIAGTNIEAGRDITMEVVIGGKHHTSISVPYTATVVLSNSLTYIMTRFPLEPLSIDTTTSIPPQALGVWQPKMDFSQFHVNSILQVLTLLVVLKHWLSAKCLGAG